MKKFITIAALGALAATTTAAQAAECNAKSSSKEACVEVMQNDDDGVVYAGSAGSLGPEAIALIIALGLGYLLVDSGSGSN